MGKGTAFQPLFNADNVFMKDGYILQVEDSADDAALTRHALRRANISNKVKVLKDGVEALDFIHCRGRYANRAGDDMPAFVLLDLKLPKVDGFEVLRNFRENDRTAFIPVVVFTSSREEKDIMRAYALRANSYVRKPVDFDRFTEVIRQIGFYWLSLNETVYEAGK